MNDREPVGPHFPLLLALSVGHLLTGVNRGAVPALLPYLRDAFGLSYAVLGSLLLRCGPSSPSAEAGV